MDLDDLNPPPESCGNTNLRLFFVRELHFALSYVDGRVLQKNEGIRGES
jgi:hypothetical protein